MPDFYNTPILAWHFVGTTLRDGRPVPPDGEPLIHDDEIVPCQQGLHASVRLLDALQYAPGETLCRVSCTGTVVYEDDKLVCSERTILWRIDATQLLREFARKCAADVARLWDMPSVVREYLETGNEVLRAAACAAAWAAARDTADAAADAAVRAAANAAVRAAARVVARAAAKDAAWAAAWAAARDTAWGAARIAAWEALRTTQNARLETMVQTVQAKGRMVSGDG
jgi:hypothetical protein